MVNLFILILSWTTYASIQIMLRNECLFSFNFIELNHEKRIFYSFVSWPFFLCSWFCFLFWAPMSNWISSSCRPKQLEQILKQTTMLKWFTISPFWNFESSHFCSGFVNPNREMFFKLPTSNLDLKKHQQAIKIPFEGWISNPNGSQPFSKTCTQNHSLSARLRYGLVVVFKNSASVLQCH